MRRRAPGSDPSPTESQGSVEIAETGRRSVEFEARRVAGRRPGLGIAIAIAVVIVIAAVGAAGPRSPRPGPLIAVEPPSLPSPTAEPDPSTEPFLGVSIDPIDLVSPASGPVTVTTPQLTVTGVLHSRTAFVDIFLEARNNRVIDSVRLPIRAWKVALRPDYPPPFDAVFDLPNPRPNGTMWVTVTAWGDDGIPIGGIRRPFLVGPLDTGVTGPSLEPRPPAPGAPPPPVPRPG